jgi:hypothetical protein
MQTEGERSYETSQPMSLSVRRFSSRASHTKEYERKLEYSMLIQSIYSKRKAKLGPLIQAHLSVLIGLN